ncbi:MAG: DNA integrity scanning protein DisA nucleotide-binding domain protein [Planctomycetia bacterium]|nr:DNA integrity scanning protein DisA nucleotide-binding domain protein [Planctomycetia bacterium]
MKQQRFNEQFASIYGLAVSLSKQVDADVLLVMLDGPTDWKELSERAGREKILVAADTAEALEGAKEAGLDTVVLGMHDAPVFEKLTHALLEGVAKEILEPNSEIIAVYSGFEADSMDSISFIRLDEHLGRLTARDLRQIETSVPLETLKVVVDLAVEIGREGREGKPVGTMFVIGDTRKVIALSHPAGFDPVKGYGRKERSLPDPRVREAIKEIAPLDGAFIVAPDGTVEKACQIVDADHVNLTLSKGLGSRHWAAAAISKSTNAIAVVVSESNGTVRLFKGGEVILRVEPFRRAMKWKDFEYEPPSATGD